MSAEHPPADFWDWSLTHYQKPGAAAALLRLQDDFGFNVNFVLWCVWCGRDFEQIPDLVLRKAHDLTTRWSADLAMQLRQVRRALKTPPKQADADRAAQLRSLVKKAELDAEEIEQLMLQALALENLKPAANPAANIADNSDNHADDGGGGDDHQTRARRNLAAYAAHIGAGARQGFTVSLLETLIAAIFSQSEEKTEPL